MRAFWSETAKEVVAFFNISDTNSSTEHAYLLLKFKRYRSGFNDILCSDYDRLSNTVLNLML